MNKNYSRASTWCATVCILWIVSSASLAQVVIEEGLDAWQTDPCDGVIDLPALPPDFFGAGSEPVPPMDDFTFKGHPFPDIFGVPNPFPESQTEVVIQWFDPHGTPVGPDSQHGVTSTPRIIIPDPPYNFDTVVRRVEDATIMPGEPEPVPIQMTWLSLVSCEPITVTTNGVESQWDVHVGLSEKIPPIEGRMEFRAEIIRPGGGGSGSVELGDTTDPVNQQFENGNFNFFNEDQNALGLPVAYQLRFIKRGDPKSVVVFDDPAGQSGIKTLALFTNDGNPDGEWRKREKDKVMVHPGLDSWATPCESFVSVPVEFGPGFFGPGSLPIAFPELLLEGWPFDFPFGRPPKFPDDQLVERHVWLDRHGSEVGPDSAHKVSQTVDIVQPLPPYNFDTVVERLNGGLFCDPGDVEDVRIQFIWLSLRSCVPIVVDFENGSQKTFWVHIGLSNRSNELAPGRMRLTAERVDPAGALLHMDIGREGDPIDQQFQEDPLAFEFDNNHLGLPLYFQMLFVEEGTEEIFQPIDDPDGQLSGGQLRTIGVMHNELGGTMHVLQVVPGDSNLDGRFDAFDISDFITALINPDEYRRLRGADPNIVCDLNGDGLCNVFDIAPFVDLLTGRQTRVQLLADVARGNLDRVFPVLGVDQNGWQVTGSAPFGIPPVQNIEQGLAELDSPNVAAGNFDAVNFADPESDRFGAGNFLGDVPFPSNTQLNDEDFAILAEATLVVPEDDVYDIGFLSDDGAFLQITGATFDELIIDATGNATGIGTDTISCDCLTADSHTVARVNLPAGEYPIRAFLFERSGSAHIEVFGGAAGAPKKLLLRNGAGFESLFEGLIPEVAGLAVSNDLDGDGVSNLDELRTGSDPLDPSSFFRIDHVAITAEGVELTWPSIPKMRYDVQFSETATPGSWKVLNDETIVADGAATSFVDAISAAQSDSGYYRVATRPLQE